MVKGLRIPADVRKPWHEIELSELEDYQRAVGGWIEAVDIAPLASTIYVNEEGIPRGLEYNTRATMLWWFHVPSARMNAALFGDVVVVGCVDDVGDAQDIPAQVLRDITSNDPWVVLMKIDGTWFRHRNVNRGYWEATFWAVIKQVREPNIEDVRVATELDAQRYPLRPIEPLTLH